MTAPLTQLTTNLSGNESASDKQIAQKVREVVSALNDTMARVDALEAAPAPVDPTATIAALTARLTKLESATAPVVVTPPPVVPPPPPPPVVTPPVVTPTPPTLTALLGGSLLSAADTKALGATGAQYETDFTAFDEPQYGAWTADPARQWDSISYYDRAAIYYARWVRTGDVKYRDRARFVASVYIKGYLAPNKFGAQIPHHNQMGLGVALYLLDTADPIAASCIRAMAERSAYEMVVDPYGYATRNTDCRILAYSHRQIRLAMLLGIASDGAVGFGRYADWATALATTKDRIFAARDADGQWRFARAKDAAGNVLWTTSHPFTIGLLHDELIQSEQTVATDARVKPAIKASADILWRDDWVAPGTLYLNPYSGQQEASVGGFKYTGKAGNQEGGTYVSADLNMLILNGYGWLGAVLGDATYKTKARAVFDGGVASRGVTGDGKHFCQIYSSSQRALSWLK